MTTHPQPTIHVHGGAGGINAKIEDLQIASDLLTSVGKELLPMAAELHRYLADADVIASAILDPGGAEHFEQVMLFALDGNHGLTWVGAELELTGAGLKLAIHAYAAADAALHEMVRAAEWGAGYAAGLAAIPVLLAAAPAIIAFEAFEKATGRHDLAGLPADLQTWLTNHTGFDQVALGALPGFLTGLETVLGGGLLPVLPIGSLGQGSNLLSLSFKNGIGGATPFGAPVGTTAPKSFQDLFTGLGHANTITGDGSPTDPAKITIEQVTGPDGTVRYVVDIPGTSNWAPKPTADPADLDGNINSMAGHNTAYEQAIMAAMAAAKIPPGAPVMLVGHSQGGMVAAQVAADHSGAGGYNITHVITAGSPIANTKVPEHVHVLSLENTHDIVPTLDGASNSTSANHVTVTFSTQNGSAGGNHSIPDAYTPAAGSLDSTTDPSVAAWKQSAGGFLTGGTSQTTTYAVTRAQ